MLWQREWHLLLWRKRDFGTGQVLLLSFDYIFEIELQARLPLYIRWEKRLAMFCQFGLNIFRRAIIVCGRRFKSCLTLKLSFLLRGERLWVVFDTVFFFRALFVASVQVILNLIISFYLALTTTSLNNPLI